MTEPTDDQRWYHNNQLNAILARWRAGELTLHGKRKAIAAENRSYHRGDHRSPATGELVTVPRMGDPVADLIADVYMVPLEAARAALDARRRASWEAAEHAGTVAEARDIAAAGVKAYNDVLAAAKGP